MTNSKAIGVAYSDQAISGGSIDNSPIGATTPSTGAFTTLSNTGAHTSTGSATFSGVTQLGTAASSYLAFYTASPTTQPTSASEAAVVTSAAITAAGAYGFGSAGQANGIVTLLNQLRSDLVTLGLIKGS